MKKILIAILVIVLFGFININFVNGEICNPRVTVELSSRDINDNQGFQDFNIFREKDYLIINSMEINMSTINCSLKDIDSIEVYGFNENTNTTTRVAYLFLHDYPNASIFTKLILNDKPSFYLQIYKDNYGEYINNIARNYLIIGSPQNLHFRFYPKNSSLNTIDVLATISMNMPYEKLLTYDYTVISYSEAENIMQSKEAIEISNNSLYVAIVAIIIGLMSATIGIINQQQNLKLKLDNSNKNLIQKYLLINYSLFYIVIVILILFLVIISKYPIIYFYIASSLTLLILLYNLRSTIFRFLINQKKCLHNLFKTNNKLKKK